MPEFERNEFADQFTDAIQASAVRKDPEAPDARKRLIASGQADDDSDAKSEMSRLRRTAAAGSGDVGGWTGSPISFATGRPRDPMFYWRENNLPFDLKKPEELEKVRDFCRLLYTSHPVLPSIIDIYAQWPIIDLRFECKDSQLVDFYSDLFFDQLGYEDFLVDVGREFWTVGEAFPLGSFNDTLGVWEDDELISPNDVKVIRSPFLKDPRLEMKVPEIIRKVLIDKSPKWEYEALLRAYPELAHFTREGDYMPVSNVLMKHLKFKADTYHPRGLPILLRAFRAIIQEEMLNAASDSVSERLYTPLLVAKLGASASDLGTSVPWVPDQSDRDMFLDSLDAALAGDFRVLVTHFATDISSAFGKESLPDFTPDFDRIMEKQLQVFGLSKTMLTGAGGGETYAADALNRDLVTQLLTHDQRRRIQFLEARMKVVAEAQEHFDYEERAGTKYPVMEEILEIDEESGEEQIIERPKLLYPKPKCRSMSLADEENERQFLEALRESGVPISQNRRLINVPIDLKEELEKIHEEQVEQAIEAQLIRRDTFLGFRSRGLPIPPDLLADFQPRAQVAGAPDTAAAPEQPLPNVGEDQPASTMALAPTEEDEANAEENAPDDEEVANPPPGSDDPKRPEESSEQMEDMPKK